jgi:4-hydroxy-tetrahydrodipicolinate synthase
MTPSTFEPQGVIPACLLPFHADLSIDERAYRKHLRDVVAVPGLAAITINAHASEVASCTFEEQERVLAITVDEVGDEIPIVHGVYADGSLEAARIARMAERGGSACLLVFPPNPLGLGSHARPEMAIAHFKTIADATSLPLICFQYPLASGLGYPVDTLMRLVDEVPSVRAIKDWCNNVVQHERQIRLLQGRARPVNVLSTHSSWLFSSLVLGCKGLLSGAGSVIADLQSALFRAVQANDLTRARQLNERIFPIAQAFYADPFVDMHNRMKEALVILGRIPCAAVRPPLVKLSEDEIARIREALKLANVASEGALRLAA